ncbi:MAG: hypothetical protein K5694_04015, partial [Bacilli bacterium]|nr:hypothetical protein [Bacilli bacterium]
LFDKLKAIYNANGYRLYIVGGTTRDLLLNRPHDDHDFVTDATPEETKAFLPEANYTFAKFGALKVKVEGINVDVTTLREEKDYSDHRHPKNVSFVKDPKIDVLRRDFTINGLYLDEDYNLLDFVGGLDDLKKKEIRFIGEPKRRIEEDPLRICRGERFASILGFEIEEETKNSFNRYRYLLQELNPQKLDEERRKGWKGSL